MFKDFDKVIVFNVFALLIIGLVVLYSAAYQKHMMTGKNFFVNQITWIFFGLLIMFLVTRINYHALLSAAYIIYAIHLVPLILVLLVGKMTYGAQRWISFAGFGFQPSEFSKIITILALARVIGDNPKGLKKINGLILPFLIVLGPTILIFIQPDLGTASIFIPILITMLLIGGLQFKYFLSMIVTVILCLPVFWVSLKEYQKDRLLVFINPNLDPLGAGYTINQSKIAIGSGMLIGKGWLAGTQNQLNFLPERHTDFIFSVVGEEWGFVGTSLIILLFASLVLRGIKIAATTNDLSGRLLVIGVTTMLALHVIINIGMTVGLMPVVGMPLPFISYGGSAFITYMIAVGLLLNVRRHKTIF